ncbi:riboflavin biosynthesis protein RibF [Desulfurobacterium sp.]
MKSCIVGKFESFHRGHQKLIEEAKKLAEIVEIFSIWPPPNTENPLFTEEERVYLAEKFHVKLINIKFDEIKDLTPEEFFTFLKTCNCTYLVVGIDWRFGKGRIGNVETAKILGKKYGIKVIHVPPIEEDGRKISTSWIKELLSQGNIEKANHLLGFNFFTLGITVKGQGIGKTIGFPTINVKTEKKLILPFGVYEVELTYKKKRFKAVANFGTRPTFNGKKPVLEVHVIGKFLKMKENTPVKVDFKRFLRKERRFNSVEELKKQIKLDVDKILNE